MYMLKIRNQNISLTIKQATKATNLQLLLAELLCRPLLRNDHLSLLQLVFEFIPLSLHMTHLLVQLLRAYMAPDMTPCQMKDISCLKCIRLSYV